MMMVMIAPMTITMATRFTTVMAMTAKCDNGDGDDRDGDDREGYYLATTTTTASVSLSAAMDVLQVDPFYLPECHWIWVKYRGRRIPWLPWMRDPGIPGNPFFWDYYAPAVEVVIDGESFALSLVWNTLGRRERARAEPRLGDDAMDE